LCINNLVEAWAKSLEFGKKTLNLSRDEKYLGKMSKGFFSRIGEPTFLR
jgi:hypothetical protein